ncbi:MAG: hypothetical protein A3J38_00775 [Gammaproteobacteria bacterium RIFCSPHIGHO2_12_FULL_45_9]|nr:MAG: hypothetical protein A3J38_00775 [Gammaproteobacteria bacterium RIFCSPHIGHO2_12_FULL_45_9]
MSLPGIGILFLPNIDRLTDSEWLIYCSGINLYHSVRGIWETDGSRGQAAGRRNIADEILQNDFEGIYGILTFDCGYVCGFFAGGY